MVLYNCPNKWAPGSKRSTLIRDATGIPDDAPVILYHGTLVARRGIEQLMTAILSAGLEEAHLVLLGFGDKRPEYEARALEPGLAGRVHLLDAVPPSELLAWIASADVGAMPIEASEPNLYLSTPNKLFECLSAGIPVVASDFPPVRRIVVDDPDGPLGAVCDPADAEAIAEALRGVLEADEVAAAALRDRCRRAADLRWNWETESRKLTDLYADLTRPPSRLT